MKALAVTALLLMAALAAGVGYLAARTDPLGGEPYAAVTIDGSARPEQAPETSVDRREAPKNQESLREEQEHRAAEEDGEDLSTPANSGFELPPGISVVGVGDDKDGSGEAKAGDGAPPPASKPAPSESSEAPATPEAPAATDTAPAGDTAGEETGKSKETPPDGDRSSALQRDDVTPLPPAPVEALVDKTSYGPLPRIADDGRRPAAVYARPSAHSTRPAPGEPARVAILVKDLGLSEAVTTAAITKLPGEVSLAFGPYGQNLQGWVRQARANGHEVVLEVPLEPFDYPDNDPGPHTLLTGLPAPENAKRLKWMMGRFTGYVGVTNNMGAKFVTSKDALQPVLKEIGSRGLIYIDDGTAARSSAESVSQGTGLDFAAAEVQIGADQTPQGIAASLTKLESIAKERGFAVATANALPVTIEKVAAWTKTLAGKGLVLIPVSAAVRSQHQS